MQSQAVLDNKHCVGVSVWALSDKLKLNNWSLQFVTFERHLCKVMKISRQGRRCCFRINQTLNVFITDG